MDTEERVEDKHLAKFPPFKGPRIGGNFEVDENVLLGEPVVRGALAARVNAGFL